jgi:hypothetical protein
MDLQVIIGVVGIGVAALALIGGLLTFQELEERDGTPPRYRSEPDETRSRRQKETETHK